MANPAPQQQPQPEYRAHQVLASRMALLRRDTEAQSASMSELQDRIEEAIEHSNTLQAEARKKGDFEELEKLEKEQAELYQAYEVLEEGHGKMQFGPHEED